MHVSKRFVQQMAELLARITAEKGVLSGFLFKSILYESICRTKK